MKSHEYERCCQEGETMPDPLLPSSRKGLMSIRIIINEENSTVFLNFCYGYHSISKNQIMCPPGRSPCGEKFFEDRKKLNSGFLRSFLVLEGVAAGLFWLYRRVKRGKPYVRTEDHSQVRKRKIHIECYGRGIPEICKRQIFLRIS
jgi:hypothetical protein